MKSPGQAAYEKWKELIPPAPINEWNLLPGSARAGWEEIAEAAIEVYEDPEGLGPIARDMEPEELARLRDESFQQAIADLPNRIPPHAPPE